MIKADVAVLGHWHLAFCTAACLASTGKKVILVNAADSLVGATGSASTPEKWTSFPKMPVHEPGIPEMIAEAQKAGNLHFANSIEECDVPLVWMAVDTPVDDQDRADTTPLWKLAQRTRKHLPNLKVFIISSQIPLGFGGSLQKELGLPVVYVPENLRLGQGIQTFKFADRTVIGSDNPETLALTQDLMKGFTTQFFTCNLATAEMVKHANNVFLAMSISFSNELARLGEKFGVDGNIVGQALRLDQRIGPKAYVIPGLGFAGGTLPRDLRALQALGGATKTPMRLVDAVLSVNEDTSKAIVEIVETELQRQGAPKGPVLILGYTYKADTDTLRRSQTLEIAEFLKAKGIQILGFDPFMNGKLPSDFGTKIQHFDRWEQITQKPAVVLSMTARPAFKELDWAAAHSLWSKGTSSPLVLDTQNILNEKSCLDQGFAFKRLWSPLKTAQKEWS